MTLPVILLYFCAVVLSVWLGVLVFLRYRFQSGGRFFLLFLFFQVCWILSLLGGYYFAGVDAGVSQFLVRLAYGFGLLMVPAVGRFFLEFPKVSGCFGRWFLWLLLPFSMVVALAAVLTDWVHVGQIFEEGVYVADVFGVGYLYYLFFVCLQFVLAILVIFVQLRCLEGVWRLKALVSGVGALAFLVLAFLFNVVLPFFGIYLAIAWLSVSFSFLFVLPTFYAIRRYRVFDFSAFSFNVLRLVLLLMMVFSVAFLVSVLLVNLENWVQIFLGILVVLLLRPFFVSLLPVEEALASFRMQFELRFLLSRLLAASSVEEVNLLLSRSFVEVLGFSSVEFIPNVSLPEKVVVMGEFFRGRVFGFGVLVVRGSGFSDEELRLLEVFLKGMEAIFVYLFNEEGEELGRQVDFLAATAHEIKTPLNIAMFQLEDVLNAHRNNPQLVEDVGVLANTLANLRDLTRRLLTFRRYDLGRLELKKSKVKLCDFLGDIYDDFKFLMEREGKNFVFLCKGSREVEIDVEQMRQVLINILSNAIKFAEKIVLTVDLSEGVKIVVEDDGCGVADDLKMKVFDKFVSGSGCAPDVYGLGMGLFIVRKIVEAHGGQVWIEDGDLGGAKVVVSLG